MGAPHRAAVAVAALSAALCLALPGAPVPAEELDPETRRRMSAHFAGALTADEAATRIARRERVDLEVRFRFDSAEIDDANRSNLDVVGEAILRPQFEGQRFLVSGHTDDMGPAPYNLDLSERRARAARAYLVARHGIDEGRIEIVGHGSERPREGSDSRDPRNRRVTVEVMP